MDTKFSYGAKVIGRRVGGANGTQLAVVGSRSRMEGEGGGEGAKETVIDKCRRTNPHKSGLPATCDLWPLQTIPSDKDMTISASLS
jgi:hypothetical protein